VTSIAAGERDTDLDRKVSATSSPRRAWWPDAAIAVALGIVAYLYRRHFPPDGLFYDDAWQAFGATRASLSQLLTVGQTQPGFGLELLVWSRLVGHTITNVIMPALIAGSLGPPALYLFLRRFGFARSIAALLGSALAVSTAHIVYSGRVKAYTAEVLIVLAVAVAVPWLARRSWGVGTAVAWFVGSLIVASFSSFALLASVGAAVILVLHPRHDLRVRLAAATAQAVAVVALLATEDRTHDASLIPDYFGNYDAYVPATLNPLIFLRETFHHLTRITAAFPGGPAWFRITCVVVVGIGLVAAALGRGRRAIAARLMIVLVAIAFVGSLMHKVPFGPTKDAVRVTLWLMPVVAFGLAVVLQRARQASARRSRRLRIGFDALAFSCAVLLLLTPIGVRRPYPPGWLAGTRTLMETIGPHDVVLIQWTTAFSFAFNADLPAQVQAMAGPGFAPRFLDNRLQVFEIGVQQEEVARLVNGADRVFVFEHNPDPTRYRPNRVELVQELKALGFVRESAALVNRASIAVYRHE
jgi:hypothetical protein